MERLKWQVFLPSVFSRRYAFLTLKRINGESHQNYIRVSIAKNHKQICANIRGVYVTFLQRICGVCMANVRLTAMTKIIQHSIVSDPLMIIKVRHRYAVTKLYTPNVRRILNYKECHGNATASNAYVAVTLHHRLALLERHGNATT